MGKRVKEKYLSQAGAGKPFPLLSVGIESVSFQHPGQETRRTRGADTSESEAFQFTKELALLVVDIGPKTRPVVIRQQLCFSWKAGEFPQALSGMGYSEIED